MNHRLLMDGADQEVVLVLPPDLPGVGDPEEIQLIVPGPPAEVNRDRGGEQLGGSHGSVAESSWERSYGDRLRV